MMILNLPRSLLELFAMDLIVAVAVNIAALKMIRFVGPRASSNPGNRASSPSFT